MKWLLTFIVIGFLALHHDIWNWKSRELVGGIMPIGLAYQAGYSVVAALVMFLLVRFAWPSHLEVPESEMLESEEGEA